MSMVSLLYLCLKGLWTTADGRNAVLARNMIEKVEHPACGTVKLVNHPVKYSRAEPKIRSPPPMLGEHTDEVLRELLDMSGKEIEDLKEQQTVA